METTTEPIIDKPLLKLERTKAHQQYVRQSGERVPGVTTALGIIDNSAPLMHWAWDLGRKGEDYRKVRDKAADIGSIAHFMIECHLDGAKWDLSDYAPADVSKAENAFLKFLEFWDSRKLKRMHAEAQLVSEKYGYGGTPDLVARDPQEMIWLFDWKTSKRVYDKFIYQLAAYNQLIFEALKLKVEQWMIVRIGKDEEGEVELHPINVNAKDWQVFLSALNLYNAVKKAGRKYE